MAKLSKLEEELKQAVREERQASNEKSFLESQMSEQKTKLDGALKYKSECVEGLRLARTKGLTPVHVRELQLLMTHIKSVIETLTYKVDVSQNNFERAREVWQEKEKVLEAVREAVRQQELEAAAAAEKAFEESQKAESGDGEKNLYYGNGSVSLKQ